ncbi:MAG: GtrA-like protein [Smithella sp. PtaU1.Bin162]|nr:MAG: GtrA-like protein [Smithella sp. PtaU1.Bin162]
MIKSWKQLWFAHQTKWRFLLVGIWNTIFGYSAFVGLDILFTYLFPKRYLAYMSAAILSNILAIINAFIFHKYITFKSKVRGKAIIAEFVRFFSTYLFTMILGLILLPFFVEVLGIDPKISGALLIPVTVIISYFGHSRFSFRK